MRTKRNRLLVVSLVAGLFACGPSAAVKHAQTLLDQGQYQQAAQVADDELARAPSDGQLHRIRIRAALGLGDAAGAVAHYRAWRQARGGKEDLAALHTMAMTTLWQGLTSPSAQVQVQAIQAIERLEIEHFARDVAERMGDDDDIVAAAASIAVLRAFPQAPEVATQMLKSDDPEARAIAVEGIGRKVGKRAADDLRFAAADPDPRVRAAAAFALGAIGDGADTGRLTELATDKSDDVRATAVRALTHGKRGDLSAVAQTALGDESLGVRLAGVDLLVASRGKEAARTLLDHPDPMVAAYAARALGDRAAATGPVDRALAADDWSVRAGAVNLLGATLTKDAARSRAAAAGKDAKGGVRLAAARALAYLGDQDAALAIYGALLASSDPGDQLDAAAELAHLGDPRGAPVLEQLASSQDPAVRRQVVGAHLAARVITAGLWSALADDQGATRLAAAAALYELGAR